MPKVKYTPAKGLHQETGSGLELFNDVQNVAATGTAIGDAAEITGLVAIVSAADGSKGVTLPASAAGKVVVICNTAGAVLKVYADVAGTKIEGNAGSTAQSVAANSTAICIYTDDTEGWTFVQGA